MLRALTNSQRLKVAVELLSDKQFNEYEVQYDAIAGEIKNIQIMNMRKIKPSELFDVRVDRASVLGNPFLMHHNKIQTKSMRNDVCKQYAKWFATKMATLNVESKEVTRLMDLYKEHGRLRLFCWCAPKRCHAETIRGYILSVH